MNSKFVLLVNVLIIYICWNSRNSKAILRCAQFETHNDKLYYYLLKNCRRSKGNVLSSKYFRNIDGCENMARSQQAFSFNYRFTGATGEVNCVTYSCPEFNVSDVEEFSLFNYYSIYAGSINETNSTCIPGIGVFLFSGDRANYTDARAVCEENGGILANILSESTTTALSDLLMNRKLDKNKSIKAYVGLDDIDREGFFVSSKGVPLDCIPYTAWAPTEPKHQYDNEDCVSIDDTNYWRVERCDTILPYICELLPNSMSKDCFASDNTDEDDCLNELSDENYSDNCEIDDEEFTEIH